jgi:hypothetical protein
MTPLLSQIFPIVYGACMLVLLWQAFKVMAKGFSAVPRAGDLGSSAPMAPDFANEPETKGDRTGRLTIHPELLDADGQITSEDLLTVRFGGDNDLPKLPAQHD